MKTIYRTSNKERNGFTFVELMFVIATVALLAFLTIPLVGKTEKPRDVTCKNNMRQIVMGMLMYADGNRDIMPLPPMHNNHGKSTLDQQVFAPGGPGANIGAPDSEYIKNKINWSIQAHAGSVFPYVTGEKRPIDSQGRPIGWNPKITTIYPVYRCPSKGIKGEILRVNYSENRWFNPQDYSRQSQMSTYGMKRSDITKPQQKVLLVDETVESMDDAGFPPNPTGFAARAMQSGALLPHSGNGNLGFCDGHVEEVSTQKLLKMMGATGTGGIPEIGNEDQTRAFYWDPTK